MKEKNLIAKSIINSKSKEEVKKYLKDNVSFSSGSFNNPLVSPRLLILGHIIMISIILYPEPLILNSIILHKI